MKKIIAGAILSLMAFAANADDFSVGIPVAAYHIGAPNQMTYLHTEYNDNQWKSFGLILDYRFDLPKGYYVGPEVGTYENSWFQRSDFVVVDFGKHLGSHVNVGLEVGAINGYGVHPEKVKPAAAPYLELKEGPFSVKTEFLLSTIPQGKNALAFSVGYHF